MTEQELESDLFDKRKQYEDFMKKWRRARETWNEWEIRRLNMENELKELDIKFEEVSLENDTWHDQRRPDFDPIKDGQHPKLIHSSHVAKEERFKCNVQCANCKRHTAVLEYDVKRWMFCSVSGVEKAEKAINITGVDGTEMIDKYWYCKECMEKML
jgi:hypothetical protein